MYKIKLEAHDSKLSFVQLTFLYFIFFDIFSGLLKAIFYPIHLNFILLLPKIMMGFIPLYYLLKGKYKLKIICSYFVVILGAIVSFYNFQNVPQALFGFYILFPFLFAYCLGEELLTDRVNYFLRLFFYTAIAGVIINRVINFPWSGMEVEVAGVQLSITKSWEALGLRRVPGFSNASYTVATQLLVLGCYFVILSEKTISRILISILTIVAIYFTTTKGAIVAYLLFLIFFVLRSKANFVFNTTLVALTLLNIWLPYKAYIDWLDKVKVDTLQFSQFDFSFFTLETMFERMQWMWPMSVNFIVENGGWIIGNGLGGIGSPLQYFYGESLIFSSADSLVVYLFGLFGMGSILMIGVSLISAIRAGWENNGDVFFKSIVLMTLAFGLTGSPVERQVMFLFIGLAFSVHNKLGAGLVRNNA